MKEPATDLSTLVLAIALAGIARADSVLALVLAYVAAWSIVNAARVVGWPPEPIAIPKLGLALLCVMITAFPLRELASRWHTITEHEALASPLEHIRDRLALEADPAIFPALVAGDRPQTYFVRASGSRCRVRFAGTLAWMDAEPLEHGVFRIEYDPRVQGAPDPSAHEETATIEIDGRSSERTMLAVTPLPHPRWLRVSPDRTRACVTSEETDEVVVVRSDAEPERLATLDGPTDCAIEDDGALRVVHRYASDVLALDAARTRSTHPVLARGAVAIGGVALRVGVFDEAAPQLAALEHPLGTFLHGHPIAAATSPDGTLVFVATRSPASVVRIVLGPSEVRITQTRALATPALALAFDSSGTRVALSLTDYGDDAHAGLGNHFVQDRIAWLDATTLALVDDTRTNWRTERQDHAGDVDRGASPMGIFATTRGTYWVAFAGTDEIEELGGASPRVIDVARFGLSAPHSVVELADGSLVVTSPSSGLVVVLDAQGALRRTIALAPNDQALLRSDPESLQLRFGERAFYEATRSGVSCQSCHLHGGTDGATHNIGGRLAAPTLDVRGLYGTSPYLRDGSYPRLRDLQEVAHGEYRGYRQAAGDRGATTEAWMRTLPLPPTFAPRDLELEREGLDVFVRAGCPECHAPPAFTSLGLHAIEAVFPDAPARSEGRLLDVPSLRGVGESAPYLYDGRADTLDAIFEHRDDRHGDTRDLDAHAMRALFTFLRSL